MKIKQRDKKLRDVFVAPVQKRNKHRCKSEHSQCRPSQWHQDTLIHTYGSRWIGNGIYSYERYQEHYCAYKR
ncbi:MAG: hypothetical protein MUD10_03115 [Candidatus Pacebacteria bacterium]|nr:hypothetical protein [Candidatus Paceibacterota bacterium]